MEIIGIKTPRKTVGRLKYEIDQHGLRPTAANVKLDSWGIGLGRAAGREPTVGARLLPVDLPLKR